MHPGFYGWWKRAHGHDPREACNAECGPRHGGPFGGHGGPPWAGPGFPGRFAGFDDDASAGFGVRRPLRFLAHKLELDEAQVGQLAAVLNELKTERAQASVDNRRRIGNLADVLEADTIDATKLAAVSTEQVKTEERVQAAVAKALGKIHAILQPDQRKKLAYLLRTGVLSI